MNVYHNSREEYYRNPFGAVNMGDKITLRLRVNEPMKHLKCYIVLWQNSEKLEPIEMINEVTNGNEVIYAATFNAPKKRTLLWYHFVLEGIDSRFYYGENEMQVGGEGVFTDSNPRSYQITVYEKDKVPSWYQEGIVYQIFPDRFYRGSDVEERIENTKKELEGKNRNKIFLSAEDWNKPPHYDKNENGEINSFEFYGGTLKGIEEKLDYLKELSVSAIYLNPIFEARSNHRYDTGDYKKIDSLLGDEESFKSLINKADKLGIKIILDGVFSHQGADSIYFNKYNNYDSVGAYNSTESKYHHWYSFSNFPEEYDCWWGVKDLPNCNELAPDYVDYICKDEDSVVKKYMKMGVAGFRLDVADELPDEFIEMVREAEEKVDKKAILIGEVWEDATNKVSYDVNRTYFLGKALNSVMNYPFLVAMISFMRGRIDSKILYELTYRQLSNYPKEYFYSNLNLVDGHDKNRVLMELADVDFSIPLSDYEKENYVLPSDKYDLAKSRLYALSVVQYLLPGVPLLYYGDEAGVYGFSDPLNRKTYPWGTEDKDLLNHYKMLGNIRSKNKAILKGDFIPFYREPHVFGFTRTYKNEKIITIINRGIFYNEGAEFVIDVEGKKAKDLFTGEEYDIVENKLKLNLESLHYLVLKIS